MTDSQRRSSVPAGHPFRRKGRSNEGLIKTFFQSNAALTIVILVLIILFLLREGVGFFPDYRRELAIYRQAGLEFVDIARKDLTAHEQMGSLLNRAYFAQVNSNCRNESARATEAAALANAVSEAVDPAHDALVRVQEAAGENAPPAELVEKLSSKYRVLLADALAGRVGKGLPATPHLTEAERRTLLEQLAVRDPLSTDDPALVAELQAALAAKQAEAAAPLAALRETTDAFQDSSTALVTLISETGDTVKATKEAAALHEIEIRKKETLLEAAAKAKTVEQRTQLEADANAAVTTESVNFETSIEPVLARLPEFRDANAALVKALDEAIQKLPANLSDEKAARYLATFRKATPEFSR
jgi:phosphate transport system permease protein